MMKFLFATEFRKNILTALSGTAAAQIIPFLLLPVLTRIYSPEELGLIAIYVSITIMLSTGITGRYERAIILPDSNKRAFHVLLVSLIFTAVFSSLIAVVIVFSDNLIAKALNNQKIEQYLLYISLSVFLNGLMQSFIFTLNRYKQYKRVALSRSLIAIIGTGTSLILGFFQFGATGLLIAYIASQIIATTYLCYFASPYFKPYKNSMSYSNLIAAAQKYSNFPKFDLLNSFVYSLSRQIVIFFFSAFYSNVVIGLYILTERVLLTPFNLFILSFQEVFYQKLSVLYNREKAAFRKNIVNAIYQLVKIITLPFLVLVFTSKYFITLVFGGQWIESYKYIFLISPYIYFTLITSPTGDVLKIINSQHISLILNSLLFLIRFITILITAYLLRLNVLQTLFWYSVASLVVIYNNQRVVLKRIQLNTPNLLNGIFIISITIYVLMYFYIVKNI